MLELVRDHASSSLVKSYARKTENMRRKYAAVRGPENVLKKKISGLAFDAPAFVAQRARDGGRCHERAAQRRRRFERPQRLRGSGGCMRRGRNRRRPAWGRTQAPTRGPRAPDGDDLEAPNVRRGSLSLARRH